VTSAGDPSPWSKEPGAKKLAESIAIKNEIPEKVQEDKPLFHFISTISISNPTWPSNPNK
jgi:hypothetical protein